MIKLNKTKKQRNEAEIEQIEPRHCILNEMVNDLIQRWDGSQIGN